MKARKKSGASAPKDKTMDYKNSLAKKYAGEEATRLSLYESQCDYMTGALERPKTGAGTYSWYAKKMRKYNHMKTEAIRRGEIEKPATIMPATIEKTVYLVYPLTKESHFFRTMDGANNCLNKKYDAWIMNEISCEYEDIYIKSMPESQADTILKMRGCVPLYVTL